MWITIRKRLLGILVAFVVLFTSLLLCARWNGQGDFPLIAIPLALFLGIPILFIIADCLGMPLSRLLRLGNDEPEEDPRDFFEFL